MGIDEDDKPTVIRRLKAARDSSDLGLDAGMAVEVIAEEGGKMDVFVPALDMMIAGLNVDHPDLVEVPRQLRRRFLVVKYEITAWTDDEIDALTGEAIVQGEASDYDDDGTGGHPDCPEVSSEIVEQPGDL